MRDFKKRRLVRSIIYSPLTASALLLATFFVLHAIWNISQTYIQTKKGYEAAHEEFTELRGRKERIEERIDTLSTPRGVEEEIRNKFGFVKKGEGVVIIVEPPIGLGSNLSDDRQGNTMDIFGRIFNIFR